MLWVNPAACGKVARAETTSEHSPHALQQPMQTFISSKIHNDHKEQCHESEEPIPFLGRMTPRQLFIAFPQPVGHRAPCLVFGQISKNRHPQKRPYQRPVRSAGNVPHGTLQMAIVPHGMMIQQWIWGVSHVYPIVRQTPMVSMSQPVPKSHKPWMTWLSSVMGPWGSSSHHGYLNTRMVIHDLDDLGYPLWLRKPPANSSNSGCGGEGARDEL